MKTLAISAAILFLSASCIFGGSSSNNSEKNKPPGAPKSDAATKIYAALIKPSEDGGGSFSLFSVDPEKAEVKAYSGDSEYQFVVPDMSRSSVLAQTPSGPRIFFAARKAGEESESLISADPESLLAETVDTPFGHSGFEVAGKASGKVIVRSLDPEGNMKGLSFDPATGNFEQIAGGRVLFAGGELVFYSKDGELAAVNLATGQRNEYDVCLGCQSNPMFLDADGKFFIFSGLIEDSGYASPRQGVYYVDASLDLSLADMGPGVTSVYQARLAGGGRAAFMVGWSGPAGLRNILTVRDLVSNSQVSAPVNDIGYQLDFSGENFYAVDQATGELVTLNALVPTPAWSPLSADLPAASGFSPGFGVVEADLETYANFTPQGEPESVLFSVSDSAAARVQSSLSKLKIFPGSSLALTTSDKGDGMWSLEFFDLEAQNTKSAGEQGMYWSNLDSYLGVFRH